MKWLDSPFAKLVGFVASILGILTTILGGIAGIEIKGDQWGNLIAGIAGSVFGLMSAIAMVTGWVLLVLQFRRDCPVCRGEATVPKADYPPGRFICPKCNGSGKQW